MKHILIQAVYSMERACMSVSCGCYLLTHTEAFQVLTQGAQEAATSENSLCSEVLRTEANTSSDA